MKLISLALSVFFVSSCYGAKGNTKYLDFNNATKQLLHNVYSKIDKKTIYCQAEFKKNKEILYIENYTNSDNIKRKKVEWEHIVPAEEFGRYFASWNIGDESCIDISKLKILGSRQCAIKSDPEFKRMYTDLYNIYPAIGFVNAKRSNFRFKDGNTRVTKIMSFANSFMNDKKNEFNKCSVIINDRSIIPPNYAKGIIARTYLYMASTYRPYKLKPEQKNLFKKWNESYPVTKDECHRAKLISKLQGNHNKIVKELCEKQKLYK